MNDETVEGEASMSIADLYKAIKMAKKRPRAVAVSSETWSSLKKAGVIHMKAGHGLGVFHEREKLPVLQGDIVIIVNPALDIEKKHFFLSLDGEGSAPAAAKEAPAGKPERRHANDRRKGPRRRTVHLGRDERRKTGRDRRTGPRRGKGAFTIERFKDE
jgi:hypothetical protein